MLSLIAERLSARHLILEYGIIDIIDYVHVYVVYNIYDGMYVCMYVCQSRLGMQ